MSSPFYAVSNEKWKNGIPIEVTPFAYAKVLLNLADLGSPYNIEDGLPGLRLRMGKMKAGPVVSDNGNFIIDAPFPETMMKDPVEVSSALHCSMNLADDSFCAGSRCSPVSWRSVCSVIWQKQLTSVWRSVFLYEITRRLG